MALLCAAVHFAHVTRMNTWCDVVFGQQRNWSPSPLEAQCRSPLAARLHARRKHPPAKCNWSDAFSSLKNASSADIKRHWNSIADTKWKECGGIEWCNCRTVLPFRSASREKTDKNKSLMLTPATERTDWIKYQICKCLEQLKAACLVTTGSSPSG